MKSFGKRTNGPVPPRAAPAFGSGRPQSPSKLVSRPPVPRPAPAPQVASLDHKLVGAVAERVHYLVMTALTSEGGIHVETLMATLGALAGFAAQNAVWRSVVDTGLLPEHGGADLQAGAFVIATTEAGERYFLGNIINAFLIPEAHQYGPVQNMALVRYLAEACANAGAVAVDWNEITALFAHTTASIGTEQFGVPRLPVQHKPHMLPKRALDMLWPAIAETLSAPLPDGRRIPAEYWPLGLGLCIAVLIERTKAVLPPTMSMRIVLEAAVPMSKVDPVTVPGARGML